MIPQGAKLGICSYMDWPPVYFTDGDSADWILDGAPQIDSQM